MVNPASGGAPALTDGAQDAGGRIVLDRRHGGRSPRPPIRRLTSMSISPGSRMLSAEVDHLVRSDPRHRR